ncbi:hypothetical protein H6F61_24215 [Cyanobacteria bacterium FACHB-472]|nr:hypothetical protein [Cyanobacteria bacterium FACHB-472]
MSVGFYPSTRPVRTGDRIKLKDTMRSRNQPLTNNLCTITNSFQQFATTELLRLQLIFTLRSDRSI